MNLSEIIEHMQISVVQEVEQGQADLGSDIAEILRRKEQIPAPLPTAYWLTTRDKGTFLAFSDDVGETALADFCGEHEKYIRGNMCATCRKINFETGELTVIQVDKFLKTIKQEGLRMSRLIEDMLTLTESDVHRFSIQKNPVELDTLLLNTCEAFEVLAKEHSLSLSLALPDTPLPMCICDPDRIRQVISILLHNAVSYTPAQGKIRVSLTHKRASGKANFFLSVSDNGIGISDEDKKKIFDRFFRAEKSRSAKGHFGLGLSIAFEIVHAHHGNITVADSKEGGSVFTVCLPEK